LLTVWLRFSDFAATKEKSAAALTQENDTLQIRLNELESWLADWLQEKEVLANSLAQSEENCNRWNKAAAKFINVQNSKISQSLGKANRSEANGGPGNEDQDSEMTQEGFLPISARFSRK